MNEKLVKFILGVNPNIICEKVVLAPCWFPDTVGLENEIISDEPCKIWACSLYGVKFTYIVSGVGAAGCLDVVTALGKTKCEEILFIGSAGGLKKGINVGDIVIPKNVICAEGASRYTKQNLSRDTYGNKYPIDCKLYNKISNMLMDDAFSRKFSTHTGDGISVESIALQFEHLSEFVENGCDFIDMESSAFLAAARNVNIRGVIAYCISDNVAQGEPLYLVSEEKTSYRKSIRKEIFPTIIGCFLDGDKNEL